MVAALGADVATNCAASRAGISRSSVIEHFRLRSPADGKEEQIAGHQAKLFTRGFERDSRLVRLAQGALMDLAAQLRPLDWRQWRHGFYLSLPDAQRVFLGSELIADEAVRRAWMDAKTTPDGEATGEPAQNSARAQRVLRQAAALAQWPAEAELAFASVAGHAGALAALTAAVADLASGQTDIAVVLGVDSLLDEETLEWLHMCGRLKCDAMPTGCQPGEAGVALAVMSASMASATGSSPLVAVGALAESREARALLSAAPASGTGLADVVSRLWTGANGGTPWIVSDHNGEFYRAMDWGNALVRLRAQFDAFADPILWYPAMSFGDTGAASPLAAVCVVARAWTRNYAPAASAVIAAASDGPERAAAVLADPRVSYGSR
jgi:3-oxoacyl-[acyl-carrier-protein] synthase-1